MTQEVNPLKICYVCKKEKPRETFMKSKKRGRTGACPDCREELQDIFGRSYSYDISILEKEKLNAYRPKHKNEMTCFSIDKELAIEFVLGGIAGIASENAIQLFYKTNELRKLVLKRDNYNCAYCNKKGFTIDHIVPKSNGGLSTFTNLITSCIKCNLKKSNFSLEEYLITMGLSEKQLKEKIMNIRNKACIPNRPRSS